MVRVSALLVSLFLASAAVAQTTINVDATADRRPIDPRVYGVNFASAAQLLDLNVTINRSGGNLMTRYNWQQNASNHANDWFYESLQEDGGSAPGAHVDLFIEHTKNGAADSMVTIPMIGWVAKLGPQRQRLSSFSIAKYGPQQFNDWEWFADAGNGRHPNGTPITGNDKNDANVFVDSTFQQNWVTFLVNKWGASNAGGVRYYMLDNEHSIWHGTHRDVRPVAPTMREIRDLMIDYASKIKAADPNAQVVGPEEWGWLGVKHSGYDQQWSGENNDWWTWPDRTANGGWDYLPFLLASFREQELVAGKRLLDVVSVHYYPQEGEYSENTTNTVQLQRNRSTRSLWDTNYTDTSWINEKIYFIPRIRAWIDRYYPGAPLAITEYSWGADAHINGATAQADVLGIFGREGVDIGNRWVTPATNSRAYNAIKMYRNYDGAKSTFGQTSVRATAPNPDNVAAFAAVRADQALTVMLVNKVTSDSAVTVNLANYASSGNAQRWELTSANSITRVADVIRSGNSLALTLPAQSITLLVVPGTADVVAPTLAVSSESTTTDCMTTFSGTASDANGIASVTWRANSGESGTATGTTQWTIGPVRLAGFTTVTVTARDASGNPTIARRNVVCQIMGQPPVPPRTTPPRRRSTR